MAEGQETSASGTTDNKVTLSTLTPTTKTSALPAPSSTTDTSKEESGLSDLLKKYPNLKKTENGERIKCVFTGHEMALSFNAVNQYVDGKKYKNFMKNPTFDLKQFEPHLQPVVTPGSGKKGGRGEGGKNADNHKQLYCQLTQRLINKDPIHVLKHVQGYRFLREKLRYDDCLKKDIPYVGVVRSKQKNMQRHDDDRENAVSDDEALGKEKKFSTNPEISDSEDEGKKKEEEDDNLEDLYPKKDFLEEDEVGKVGEEKTDEAEEGSTSEEVKGFSDSSTSSEDEKDEGAKTGFKGLPFKMPPPSKRKSSNGAPVKRRAKKKKVS